MESKARLLLFHVHGDPNHYWAGLLQNVLSSAAAARERPRGAPGIALVISFRQCSGIALVTSTNSVKKKRRRWEMH